MRKWEKISWLTFWLTHRRCFKNLKIQSAKFVSYQLWTCLSLWESDRRYFTIMLHIASSDQKQMAALTGSPPRVNSQNWKICSSRGSFKISFFKTCHFFATWAQWDHLLAPIVRMKSCEKTLVLAALTIDYLKRWEKTSKFLPTNCLSTDHIVGNKNFPGPTTKLPFCLRFCQNILFGQF